MLNFCWIIFFKKNKLIKAESTLILDEPEIHLHPS